MAKQIKTKRKRKKKVKEIIAELRKIAFAILIIVAAFFFVNDKYLNIDGIPSTISILRSCGLAPKPDYVLGEGETSVTFIDVGQGDCTLIKTNEKTVLIDSGEEENASAVISFLRYSEISKLDLVIITHPHSDHCGSMATVLKRFNADLVLMPGLNSKWSLDVPMYSKLMNVISEKEIRYREPECGEIFRLSDDSYLQIVAPVENTYDDMNENSIAATFFHGENSFLFMGDTGFEAEYDIIDSGANIDVDVLKVGHHGSAGSTSLEFLRYVTPETAVFLVGFDNSYGHPKEVVFDRLIDAECRNTYSTMNNGSIVFVSNGQSMNILTERNGSVVLIAA